MAELPGLGGGGDPTGDTTASTSNVGGAGVNSAGTTNVSGAAACAQAAYSAGFRGADLVTAVAVAGAESHWNAGAHCLNCVPGISEDSRGAWQINVRGNPQFASANLYNLGTCAQAAYQLYRGSGNFHDWSTYTSGAFLAYWAVAAAACRQYTNGQDVAAPGGPSTLQKIADGSVGDAVAGAAAVVTTPLSIAKDAFGLLTNPHTWYRVVLVVGGIGMVGIGVVYLDKSALGGAGSAAAASGGNAAGQVGGFVKGLAGHAAEAAVLA